MNMFRFLDLFKKKPNPIPTIKVTTQHKVDDRKKHEIFLTELEDLLISSNLFKAEYIKQYKNLYKAYKAFTGKDHTLLSKQPYFIESLRSEERQLKKNEIKRYSKNIVLLASRRAVARVTLDRFHKDKLFNEVILIFPTNDLICETVIAQKRIYNNKVISISKAPIYPLKSCIRCPACHLGIHYKPNIRL